MTAHEVLVKARGLVEDPAHWLSDGRYVDSYGERYCAHGACAKAAGLRVHASRIEGGPNRDQYNQYDQLATRLVVRVMAAAVQQAHGQAQRRVGGRG